MTNAPLNVWNEVRITSEGISISLFSESTDGPAIVEDELWFTFDELELLANSEPQSLNLSDETVENLADQRQSANVAKIWQADTLDEKAEHLPENPSTDELLAYMGLSDMSEVENVAAESQSAFETGDVVRDTNPPSWSDGENLEIVNISDQSADEYIIEETIFRDSPDKTVADANPSCDPDEQVYECVYLSDLPVNDEEYVTDTVDDKDVYAFPESRIEDTI